MSSFKIPEHILFKKREKNAYSDVNLRDNFRIISNCFGSLIKQYISNIWFNI